MSLSDKLAILDWLRDEKCKGRKIERCDVIDHISEKYGTTVSLTFVTTLRKNEDKIRASSLTLYKAKHKRLQPGNVRNLEGPLKEWFLRLEGSRAVITDEVLMEKARQIGVSVQLPPHFKYSPSWLLKFKQQLGVSEKVMHGEEAAANTMGIEQARDNLPGILSDYELEDIWNLDETGLFYRTLPT